MGKQRKYESSPLFSWAFENSSKLYAIGGRDPVKMIRVEVYDVEQNLWNNFPDMPEGCVHVSCV